MQNKVLLALIFVFFSIPVFAQYTFKSSNHYSIAVPAGWHSMDSSSMKLLLDAREREFGYKSKNVLIEAIIYEGESYSVPYLQVLFNPMNLNGATFPGFVAQYKKLLPKTQSEILDNEKISNIIISSTLLKPSIDSTRNMYLYSMRQEVADFGTIIVTSGNFMAKNGIIIVNFYIRETDIEKYSDVIKSTLNSLVIESENFQR
jgi:hypothetical protein